MTYITSIERIGMQKGIEKGVEQGILQGMQQGMQQGQLTRGREAILNVLETRFVTVPLALVRRINALEDDALLRHLLRQAVLASSVEDFARSVDKARAECTPDETDVGKV